MQYHQRKYFQKVIFLGLFLYCILGQSIYSLKLPAIDLTSMNLVDLMNVEVTVASRKAEKISEIANAVYILTKEDIQGSGYSTLPELFRLVPGMQVGRIDANKWAIASRGFNHLYSNKLLVLIDGRRIYTPIFSGVYWDSHDLILEDIERIEVIRGPGATMWGSNAVNGIINIITKSTKEHQGGLLSASISNTQNYITSLRYESIINDNVSYRVYGKYATRDPMIYADGTTANDEWITRRSGLRFDGQLTSKDQVMIQSEFQSGTLGSTLSLSETSDYLINLLTTVRNWYVKGQWTHHFSPTSELIANMNYTHTYRDENPILTGQYYVIDFDMQHRFGLSQDNEIVWGLGFRGARDNIQSALFRFEPDQSNYYFYSGFIQDEMSLRDNLSLSIGSKFEYYTFTKFNFQPSLRLLYVPTLKHSLWAAISHAVRIPSRGDLHLQFPLVDIQGNPNLKNEELTAFELGDHYSAMDNLYMDASLFYHYYNHALTREPVIAGNNKRVHSYGTELSIYWSIWRHLRIRSGYSYLNMNAMKTGNSVDPNYRRIETMFSPHQFHFHAIMNFAKRWDLNVIGRYVGPLTIREGKNVNPYFELDTHLLWHLNSKLDFSIIGRNLIQNNHSEFIMDELSFVETQVLRQTYIKVNYNF